MRKKNGLAVCILCHRGFLSSFTQQWSCGRGDRQLPPPICNGDYCPLCSTFKSASVEKEMLINWCTSPILTARSQYHQLQFIHLLFRWFYLMQLIFTSTFQLKRIQKIVVYTGLPELFLSREYSAINLTLSTIILTMTSWAMRWIKIQYANSMAAQHYSNRITSSVSSQHGGFNADFSTWYRWLLLDDVIPFTSF